MTAMPDWERLFGDTTLLQAVLWVVAAVLLIGVVVKLWPFIRNAVAIVDALVQLPGMSVQVSAMKDQIDSIHHETHKNDGSSIKDAVGRVETSLEGIHGRLDTVETAVTTLARADEEIRAEIENTQDPKEKP